jgi:hypothetical protein
MKYDHALHVRLWNDEIVFCFKEQTRHSTEKTEKKNYENISQDSRYLDWDMNGVPPENKYSHFSYNACFNNADWL